VILYRKGHHVNDIYACRGMVICKGSPVLQPTTSFRAKLLTLPTLELPIIPGSSFELYVHGEEVLCRVVKIYSMTVPNKSEGTATVDALKVNRPKCVGGGRQAAIKIQTDRPVCVEPFDICNALGRFALRTRGKTCAVGIITN
jgi:translation elongation factor EF-1alpha